MPLLNTWEDKWFMAQSFVRNVAPPGPLAYIVEPKDWAIQQVGRAITQELTHLQLLKGFVTATPWKLRRSIIHFGSLHTLTLRGKKRPVDTSNAPILTIFHVIPNKQSSTHLQQITQGIRKIHTSCQTTKQQLLSLGIPAENIVVIPLGVDRSLFQPLAWQQRQNLRARIGIPTNRIVIGSFQKDGVGWRAGNEPKREKGPDIFVKVIAELAKQYPVHVLLVGPARGYVQHELERSSIPHTSIGHVRHLEDVAPYYGALDLYLITSRIEGGPLSLLQAWASGVPVVSTKVGMVGDIAIDEQHALLADSEDILRLAEQCTRLFGSTQLRIALTKTALDYVEKFTWPIIARRYYTQLYEPQLSSL